MRTTLDLPEELIEEARKALGLKSKTETVVFALRNIVRRDRLDDLKAMLGRIEFDFEPAELRKKDRARVGV
jgi:Arc/MetJ family transcription regulator